MFIVLKVVEVGSGIVHILARAIIYFSQHLPEYLITYPFSTTIILLAISCDIRISINLL
jgi:hypothetical protein